MLINNEYLWHLCWHPVTQKPRISAPRTVPVDTCSWSAVCRIARSCRWWRGHIPLPPTRTSAVAPCRNHRLWSTWQPSPPQLCRRFWGVQLVREKHQLLKHMYLITGVLSVATATIEQSKHTKFKFDYSSLTILFIGIYFLPIFLHRRLSNRKSSVVHSYCEYWL